MIPFPQLETVREIQLEQLYMQHTRFRRSITDSRQGFPGQARVWFSCRSFPSSPTHQSFIYQRRSRLRTPLPYRFLLRAHQYWAKGSCSEVHLSVVQTYSPTLSRKTRLSRRRFIAEDPTAAAAVSQDSHHCKSGRRRTSVRVFVSFPWCKLA